MDTEERDFKIVDSKDSSVPIEWVCVDCAQNALRSDINMHIMLPFVNYATYHMGICDICKQVELVTRSRVYRYPKFKVPIDWE